MEVSTRPKNVVRYERLAYLAVALTFASMPLNWTTLNKYLASQPIVYPIALVSILGLQIAWIWLIARKRKNWARVTSLVLLVAGILSEFFSVTERIAVSVPAAVAYYFVYVVWIAAMYFLFTGDAPAWFRQQSQSDVEEVFR